MRVFHSFALPAAVGCFACACALQAPLRSAADEIPFRVPEGFSVARVADDTLAHDLWCLTLDEQGRIVAGGPGYIKRLEDTDGDGRADAATTLASFAKGGPQGLCYFDGDLYHVGPERLGVILGPTERSRATIDLRFGSSGEHGAHAIIPGPDGRLYVVCGNDTKPSGAIDAHAGLQSPVAGRVLQIDPRSGRIRIFAWGFRNPYDLAFSVDGRLLTVDSDNERAYHLPWYAPTRLLEVAPQQGHGWLLAGYQTSWNRPASWFDSAPRIVELGRGSPTGLEVYRHTQFPQHYRNGVFSACWTLGRVYFVALSATDEETALVGKNELFLEPAGNDGFAPVDLAVSPEGDLLVAIGGRQTQGGVFRVRYDAGFAAAPDTEPDALTAVLQAPQPQAAWSRVRWKAAADSLGRVALLDAALDDQRTFDERVRAVEIITELFGGLESGDAARFAEAPAAIRARAAWSLGCRADTAPANVAAGPRTLLESWANEDKPAVQRAAFAALDRFDAASDKIAARGFSSPIRAVRAAARAYALRDPATFETAIRQLPQDLPRWLLLAQAGEAQQLSPAEVSAAWEAAMDTATNESLAEASRLEALRLMQILAGDIEPVAKIAGTLSGYVQLANGLVAAQDRQSAAERFVTCLSTAPHDLQLEFARTLALLKVTQPEAQAAIASLLTVGSAVEDDVHCLTALACLPSAAPAEVVPKLAASITQLHFKLAASQGVPSREWPAWVGRVYAVLCQRNPPLARAVIERAEFGLPEHVLFTSGLDDELRRVAAIKIVAGLAQDSDRVERITPDVVQLVTCLDEMQALATLRRLWDTSVARDAIAVALARFASGQDRTRLIDALATTDAGVVKRVADALAKLFESSSAMATVEELTALLSSLERLTQSVAEPAAAAKSRTGAERAARLALVEALQQATGQQFAIDHDARDLRETYNPCFDWFKETYPQAALWREQGTASVDWNARWTAVDWQQGDAERGRIVFQRRLCAGCHQGSDRLGPDLTGVAARLKREDLWMAIVAPNRNFTPQYEATLAVTRSGQVHQGMIVYESPEGTLLRTGATTTVRIDGADLARLEPSGRSFMPEGLLDNASDQELADLYTYLRTLIVQ